jgi:thiol-disulfide isomerase/thioredoxin
MQACVSQDAAPPAYLTTQPFPDSVQNTTTLDQAGRELTLRNILDRYKGKQVVVDIWASWCRDCILSVPKLRDLKNEGDQNIIYLMLSIDKDDTKWKSAITRFNIPGEHYRIKGDWNNPLGNYIVLDWVPRYMILDKSGRIVKPKATNSEELGFLLSR